MRTIFGESVMPPEAAAVVIRAVNRAVAVGDVPRNARWQFVELLAADYLAGQYTERELRRAEEAATASPQATTINPTTQGEP
jgi:hypothetical protein